MGCASSSERQRAPPSALNVVQDRTAAQSHAADENASSSQAATGGQGSTSRPLGSAQISPSERTARRRTRNLQHLAATASQPNRPLNPPPAHSVVPSPPSRAHYDSMSNKVPPLSRAGLLKERRDFFDTRVNGRPMIWKVVERVCELIESSSLEEAQAVLNASGCTCPTGDVWGRRGGIYDELGEKYVVPAWVIQEPPDIVSDDIARASTIGAGGSDHEVDKDESDGDDAIEKPDEDSITREKGKGKAVNVDKMTTQESTKTEQPKLKVRARLSHTAQDVFVQFKEEDKVRVIVKRIREMVKLSPKTDIKIAYLGKILYESETLTTQGWREGYAVNVYVFEPE